MATLFRDSRTGRWVIQYRDPATGKRPKVHTRTQDRRVALQVKARVEADVARRQTGVVDSREEGFVHADRVPVGEHVVAYLAWCEAGGQDAQHRATKRLHLERCAKFLRASRLSDITPDGVSRFLRALRIETARAGASAQQAGGSAKKARTSKPASARTVNAHRQDLVAFTAWCVKTGRLRDNPLSVVPRANERTDRRRERRAFTAEELGSLLAMVRKQDQEKTRGRPRASRYLVYLSAVLTGLRRGELQRLEWRDLDLEAATLRVRADISKAGREDILPLHPRLAAELRSARPECVLPRARVFWTMPSARTFKLDLKRAGIDREDEEGRVVDFHSLRGTLATELARIGTAPQIAMRILRHAKVDTTLKHYTHLRVEDAARALARITEPESTGTGDAGTMTGTDGPEEARVHSAVHSGAPPMRDGAERCAASVRRPSIAGADESADAVVSCASLRDDARSRMVGDAGLEPATPSLSSWCSSQLS